MLLQATFRNTATGAVVAQMARESLIPLNRMRCTWLQTHFGDCQIRSHLKNTSNGALEGITITHPDGRIEELDVHVRKVGTECPVINRATGSAQTDLFGDMVPV